MTRKGTARANEMWDEGARWDEILLRLRDEGFSKIDSIHASMELLRLPLADAKRLVHNSQAWADRRSADDEFHQSVVAWLDDVGSGELLDLPVTAVETLAEARAADEV